MTSERLLTLESINLCEADVEGKWTKHEKLRRILKRNSTIQL